MDRLKVSLTLGFALIVFTSQAIWVNLSPIATYVAGELGVSVELIGILSIIYPFFFLILTLPSGLLLDKNFKWWFLFGSITTTLAAVGRVVYPNYLWLLACQLLSAVGQPFLLNSFVPFVSIIFRENKRALVISLLTFSMYLGPVFSLAFGVFLYSIGGLSLVLFPPAVASVLGILLILMGLKKFHFDFHETKIGDPLSIRQVIWRKDLWLVSGILGFGVASFDNLATWLQPVLSNVGLGKVAGRVVALAIILGVVGLISLPHRVVRRNMSVRYLRLTMFIVAFNFGVLSFKVDEFVLFLLLPLSGFLLLPSYSLIMNWIEIHCDRDLHGRATGFVGLVSRAISVSMTLGAILFIKIAYFYFVFLMFSLLTAFIFSLLLSSSD